MMPTNSYHWYVKHTTMGRVIVCDIVRGVEVYCAIMALWPWERRHKPHALVKKMYEDAQQIVASIQLQTALSINYEVSHDG